LPEGLGPGTELELELDIVRRQDNSEQHTGQHLVSATLLRLFGEATRSVHVGAGLSTIDFDGPPLDESGLEDAEAAVNDAIAEDYPIVTHLCPPEDISSFPLRRIPPVGEETIRVVEIDGIDFTPCCGTHLSSTGALRLVLILGAEKYKGMTRLSFLAGERAVAFARRANRDSLACARALGVGAAEVPAGMERSLARLKAAEFELKGLLRGRAEAEAAAAIASSPAAGPVLMRYGDRDAELILETAKALADKGRIGLVASVPGLTACALAPGRNAELGRRLKGLSDAAGGKGGGSASFFRAAFPSAGALEAFLGAAAAELSRLS
jgi:alanyl-tRNA synthetase